MIKEIIQALEEIDLEEVYKQQVQDEVVSDDYAEGLKDGLRVLSKLHITGLKFMDIIMDVTE